jgi:hypothetical protein
MYKPGDIGFVHNGALISKIISFCMGSKWSHSFLVLGDVHGTMMVIETSDYEVTISPLDRYLDGRPVAIYRNESLTDEDTSNICKKALPLLGTTYGYAQLISFGIRELLRKFGININNFIRAGLVCCAVPLYAYEAILGIDPESIQTEELYQIIKKSFSMVHKTIKD